MNFPCWQYQIKEFAKIISLWKQLRVATCSSAAGPETGETRVCMPNTSRLAGMRASVIHFGRFDADTPAENRYTAPRVCE